MDSLTTLTPCFHIERHQKGNDTSAHQYHNSPSPPPPEAPPLQMSMGNRHLPPPTPDTLPVSTHNTSNRHTHLRMSTGGCGYSLMDSLTTRVVNLRARSCSMLGLSSPHTVSTCTGGRAGRGEGKAKGSGSKQKQKRGWVRGQSAFASQNTRKAADSQHHPHNL
jgi:hypothetical protein